HSLPPREGLFFGRVGQSRIHVRRRWWDVLAEKLFANEDSTSRGRCLERSGGRSQERRLPQQSRPSRAGRKPNQFKLSGRRREFIQGRQIGAQESVIGGE